ncbi:glutamine synthetase, chloroplastic-like [Eucalyptus grandis]|uniref:Glutamate--ammonia ligase n=1 Tax=Eucalyptus globulus TaxID=34317 RepID=A0ABD3LF87_EUCGL|nr:glutamine synthetase, chloroplastic-like [Eucalyptus grandis]
MREEGGFEVIKKAIRNLSLHHEEHISAYGEGLRESMKQPTDTLSLGVADCGCSICGGRDNEKQRKGTMTMTIPVPFCALSENHLEMLNFIK